MYKMGTIVRIRSAKTLAFKVKSRAQGEPFVSFEYHQKKNNLPVSSIITKASPGMHVGWGTSYQDRWFTHNPMFNNDMNGQPAAKVNDKIIRNRRRVIFWLMIWRRFNERINFDDLKNRVESIAAP
jgi:hypothetical protein